MADIFDIYDELPHLNCGKCLGGSCMKFAEALAQGKAKPEGCGALKENERKMAAVQELLREE